MTVPQVIAYKAITRKKEKKKSPEPLECKCENCIHFSEEMRVIVTDLKGYRSEYGYCITQASYVNFLWSCTRWRNKLTKLDVKIK